MTEDFDETTEAQPTETEDAVDADVGVELDAPDRLAYDELCDEFSEELILADLSEVVKNRVRDLYDNQEMLRQRLAQAQQKAQQR